MLSKSMQRGVTLIELMIGLAIVALLLFLGVPAFATFLQNTQIRNAAETTLQGLNLARAEAVQLNTPVRFQLVSDLTSSCSLSANSLYWIVSLQDPTGQCNATPAGGNAPSASAPQIVEVKDAHSGSPNVAAAATVIGSSGPVLIFNGLGRVATQGITQIDFTNPAGGNCQSASTPGPMRCLRIQVSAGGLAKMCDPKVTDVTDPRVCD